jgi:hypothetical protein
LVDRRNSQGRKGRSAGRLFSHTDGLHSLAAIVVLLIHLSVLFEKFIPQHSVLVSRSSGSVNFFLFIHAFFGIRQNPGGNLSVRLVNESCSLSLFSRVLFRQQLAISFQTPDLLCLERPRVFVLAKQLRQRMRHWQ